MEDKTILTEEEIQEYLKDLDNWKYVNNSLEKEFKFSAFKDLVSFLKKAIETMDSQNHHSDLIFDTKNKTIKISVTTHSENAITKADIDFAKALDKL